MEAIKCFQRATQLQPQLAHSYTLLGHEYTDLEQYDEANTTFRRALQVDGRHYSAWVGLGRVQEKLGKFELALKNYLNAEKINPENGVLLTHIAKLHDKLGNPRLGLNCVQRASKLDLPEKPAAFVKLQTARLYLRLDSPMEALQELRLAEKVAPDESNVHFLLGKAYSMLGKGYKGNVLRCFTIALSLNPRDEAIKEAMSSLDDD
ncbi:anaphase-promoting complex subunit cdc27 [Neonectria magnoliae]|uniref:Anaphase-promoting complex subunit cdc27 n=1 Tax=Neonectria magnoliae TaxID=2732573 RepID=A0ABR1I814_9HYPO